MVRQSKVLIVLLSLLPLVAVADYTVKCEGSNSESSAPVYGDCMHGVFTGVDSETGNEVEGECEIGGSFEARDLETGEYVSGVCEDSAEDDGDGAGAGEDDEDPNE